LVRELNIIALLVFFIISYFTSISHAEVDVWIKVDEGLFVGEFNSPIKSKGRDLRITIVKIDPRYYSFKLLCGSEYGNVKMTARRWSMKFNLVSALNAGMFLPDGITNVGYMKNFNHINSSRWVKNFNAVLAFNPIDLKLPDVQIIDLKCHDFQMLKNKYQTLIQGIRMISCQQENVWSKQDKMWTMAIFGMDKNGNALFIFNRSPCSAHDLVDILLSLPISIYNAMYLEGGREAQLYFSSKGMDFERIGSYEGGFSENGGPEFAIPIPNVIGITKKVK
jgi:hypothetical protein